MVVLRLTQIENDLSPTLGMNSRELKLILLAFNKLWTIKNWCIFCVVCLFHQKSRCISFVKWFSLQLSTYFDSFISLFVIIISHNHGIIIIFQLLFKMLAIFPPFWPSWSLFSSAILVDTVTMICREKLLGHSGSSLRISLHWADPFDNKNVIWNQIGQNLWFQDLFAYKVLCFGTAKASTTNTITKWHMVQPWMTATDLAL